MPPFRSSNASATLRRELSQRFTPFTRFHHPLLDPKLPDEDVALVPKHLVVRGGLNWELPEEAGQSDGESADFPDTQEFLENFHAKIINAHLSISRLEDFVMDWFDASKSLLNAHKRWDKAEDQRPESMSVRRSSVYSDDFDIDNEEFNPRPMIVVTSPISQPCANLSTLHAGIGEDCDEIEHRVTTTLRELEIEPLKEKRSFGPYELFWMKNDPYGYRRSEGSKEVRKVFSTHELREDNEWLTKARTLSGEFQNK
ncbi:MAG: hypothetical protein Q9164_005165 [Protoblastenia rupestris]